MSEKSPKNIPTEQLTHVLWVKAQEQAEAEKTWVIKENQRLALLAELTSQLLDDYKSNAAAEREARQTKEYRDFLEEMGEAKKQQVLARAAHEAVALEIKMRLNKSFQDRAEYSGGKLNT